MTDRLVLNIKKVPEEIERLLMDWTGDFLQFSPTLAQSGWIRFDFPLHDTPNTKITNLSLPNGVTLLVRDYLQVFQLKKMYPHLKFEFEKQPEHFVLERLCGLKWEDLVSKKSIHINGKTAEDINNQLKPVGRPFILKDETWRLPWVVGQLRNLKSFGITESTCVHWPKNMAHLKNLTELYNTDNDFSHDLDDWIGELPKLQKLTWQCCKKISSHLKRCKRLTELYLDEIHDCKIPNLSHLKWLEVLSIDKPTPKDGKIPYWIGDCKNLKELCIQHGTIKELNKNLINLDLDYFSVQDNKIEELPNWINYISAGHINISNNEIEELPKSFINLDYNVNYVSIFGNPIRVLPVGIEQLKNRVQIWHHSHDGITHNSLCRQDIELLDGITNAYVNY